MLQAYVFTLLRAAASLRWSVAWAFVFGSLSAELPVRAATPAGTIIKNQAEVLMTTGSGGQRIYRSNTDQFAVAAPDPPPARSSAGFYRIDNFGTTDGLIQPVRFLNSAGALQVLDARPGPPSAGGLHVQFRESHTFRSGERLILHLVDPDQNYFVTDVETITVEVVNSTGTDRETFQLHETGANTGVFAGFIESNRATATPFDGRLSSLPNSRAVLSYADPNDPTDRVEVEILIDPYGVVFDSTTGEPINGVSLTLIDEATGQPAIVYGLDGVSRFPSTVTTGQTVQDASGAIYALEAGNYVFPFVAAGRYRYRVDLGPRAGFSFPSTATAAQLATVPGGPYAVIGASHGGTFDLVADPVKADIPLDPSATALALTMTTAVTSAGVGDFVKFDLELSSQRALRPFTHILIEDTLPAGFRLEPSSLRIDNVRTSASTSDGRAFSFRVPLLTSTKPVRISYVARIVSARPGRAVNSAIASSGTARSGRASASVIIRDELMATRAHLLGRVTRWEDGRDSGEGLANVAVFLETGAMSVTDQRGFFRFEGLLPGTHVVQLDTATLPSGARAVLPQGDTQAAGRAWSRFVDLAAGSAWNVEFFVEVPSTPLPVAEKLEPTASELPFGQDWIEAQNDAQDWLLPDATTPLPLPVTKILVKHHPGHKLKVLLNGELVSPINFEGTVQSKTRPLAASLWRGINLKEGENSFEVIREDSFGIERRRERRIIRYAAPPVRAELVPLSSTLVADGVTVPVIALRLFDRENNPARAGVTGRFAVHEPYSLLRDEKFDLRLVPGALPEPNEFTVAEDGVVLIKLQPTATSGTARISLGLAQGEHEVQADLRGQRNEWIVVGLAEGTPAWQTVSGHLENADATLREEGFSSDGRVAFFAKGKIRGTWLLTAAYDSDKEKTTPRSLHGQIDPDAYYTVYGDENERLENAPSSRKLYVKLERDAVAALFGDFSLDWTSTAFTTYSRELHGAKVDYRGEKLRASVFQSDAGLTHARDELPGNGLSGPYILNRRQIVPFSERIVIEERDRLRPDRVLASTPLSHNVDYTIDYLGGIVRLGQPLMPSSTTLNPQYLVVKYELEDQTVGTVEGARVEYAPTSNSTVGVAHLRETHNGRTDTLTGVDARLALTDTLTAAAEAAQSHNAAGTVNAYRAELAHRSEKTDTRVYLREAGAGFGLNQLNNAQVGNRQFGLEAAQQITAKLTAREQVFRETVLGTGDERDAGEAQLEWISGAWSYRSGFRAARDVRALTVQQSVLATAGLSRRFLDERLELSADREQSVAGEAENLDFPTRTVLGAKYALSAKTSLVAQQEWTEAKNRETAVSRLGLTATPWTGGALTGGVTQAYAGTPSTTLGSGLNQSYQVSPTLTLEGGFERAQVVHGATATTASSSNFSSTAAFHPTGGFSSAPQGESTSAFAGFHWKPAAVLYNARFEFSDAAGAERIGAIASAQTEAGRDLGLLASLMTYQQDNDMIGSSYTLDARLGAAWRPAHGSTIVLQRLDLVHQPSTGSEGSGTAWKAIENLHLNRRFGRRWQASFHFGGKYVLTGIGGQSFDSVTTLGAFEVRLNLTPTWDLGFNSGALSSWGLDTHDWSTGLSLGHTFAKNVWVSLGYNFVGFIDTDFTAARYTSPGVYVRFRVKFDQESLAGLLNVIKAE